MKYNKYISRLTFSLIIIWSFIILLSLTNDSSQIDRLKIISIHIITLWIAGISLLYYSSTAHNKIVKIVFIWLIYIILVNIFTLGLNLKVFETLIWWPLSFNIFFLIGNNDHTDSIERSVIKNFKVFFIVLYALVIFSATRMIDNALGISVSIYYLICLIPLVLTQKPNYKYLFLILIFIASIFSTKRGAFISISVVLVYIILDDWKSSVKLWFRILLFFLLGSFLVNLSLTKTNFFIIEKLSNTKNDEGSGRLDIFQETWEKYLKQSSVNQILGSGHNAVALENYRNSSIDIKSRTAHNDFLEILYDYGIIGIILYLTFIISLFNVLKKSKRYNVQMHQALIASLLVFFLLSLYTHLNLYPENYLYLTGIWGFIIGKLNSKSTDRKMNLMTYRNRENPIILKTG